MGPHNTSLRGEWVRSLRTDCIGFIVAIERPRNRDKIGGRYSTDEDPRANEPRLWIVYPPIPGSIVKKWSTGFALREEIKRKKWPNYYEEE